MNDPMSPVIAKREMTRTTQHGTTSLVEVRIGTPTFEEATRDRTKRWCCTVQILGIGEDRIHAVFGADAVQALYLALALAGVIIASSPAAKEIVSEEANFGFPPLPEITEEMRNAA